MCPLKCTHTHAPTHTNADTHKHIPQRARGAIFHPHGMQSTLTPRADTQPCPPLLFSYPSQRRGSRVWWWGLQHLALPFLPPVLGELRSSFGEPMLALGGDCE